ncbi:MAG: YihY/virulence factor BrkB family protein [bacterium]
MQQIMNLYKKISSKSYSTLAGSIAFFLIVNGGSVFFLINNICNVLGYEMINYIDIDYLPDQLNELINSLYQNSIQGNKSIFYGLTSIVSGSTLFYHIIKISEIIYEDRITEITWLYRVFSILLVIVFLLLVVLAFVSFLVVNSITKNTHLNFIVKYGMMFFIPFFIILYINKVATPFKNKLGEIILGVLFSTLFWFVVTIGFSIFLNIFLNYKNSYGALSVFIVFMVWMYLLSQGLIIGMIINYNYSLKKVNNHTILMAHNKEEK